VQTTQGTGKPGIIIGPTCLFLTIFTLKFQFILVVASKPKIFHGHDSELEDIMQILGKQLVRIAILGGGGMGKTSLAKVVLHHPDTVANFGQRFFVSAEAATTSVELAALIALHVGLNPGKDLTKPVVQFFARKSPSLLILDNLETVWEPIQSRGGIEEFLSMLTDIEHLKLIVCPALVLAFPY
jgi:hypothetical protein